MRHGIARTVLADLIALAVAGTLQAQTSELGHIDFPASGPPEAQEHFVRGTLLLHSFQYGQAAEAFREAQKLEPDFAIAYWGEAMTYNHSVWQEQDYEAARAVLQRLAPTPEGRLAKAPTEREKDYLRAVEILYGDGDKRSRDFAYAEAMRKLMEKYPDDDEAAAFYSVALLGTAHEGRDHRTYIRAAAVVEPVFRDNPQHPGAAHYLIHSYDDPVHAPLGLRAARAYSKIAPAASHAQHMTSHIFLALGMWDDVVSANERSWAVSGGRNYHGLFWLEYGYLQQGRYEHALKMLQIMREAAESNPTPRTLGYLARMRAAYIIETHEWEGSAVEISVETGTVGVRSAAMDRYATGLGALRRGDQAGAEKVLAEMKKHRLAMIKSGRSSYPPDLQAAEALEKELQASIWLEQGKAEDAVRLLREATVIEESMPFEFGPPYVVKPSHELLAEVFLELGRPEEARTQFELALARAPRRVMSLLGRARAAERAGDRAPAAETYAELRKIWHRADQGLPELREVASKEP